MATSGSATPPLYGTSSAAWFAEPVVDAAVGFGAPPCLCIWVGAVSGWAAPSADVRTPAAVVAHWVAPSRSLTLGLEILWGA